MYIGVKDKVSDFYDVFRVSNTYVHRNVIQDDIVVIWHIHVYEQPSLMAGGFRKKFHVLAVAGNCLLL